MSIEISATFSISASLSPSATLPIGTVQIFMMTLTFTPFGQAGRAVVLRRGMNLVGLLCDDDVSCDQADCVASSHNADRCCVISVDSSHNGDHCYAMSVASSHNADRGYAMTRPENTFLLTATERLSA